MVLTAILLGVEESIEESTTCYTPPHLPASATCQKCVNVPRPLFICNYNSNLSGKCLVAMSMGWLYPNLVLL